MKFLAHNLKRENDTGTVAVTPCNGGAICCAAALALSLPLRDPTPALKAHILAESDRPQIAAFDQLFAVDPPLPLARQRKVA